MTNVVEIDPVTNQKFYKAGNDMLFKSVFSDKRNRDLLERIIEVTVGKKVKIIKDPLMQELIKPKINNKKKTLDVLVEDDNTGFTSNYLKVKILSDQKKQEIVRVKLLSYQDKLFLAEVCK